MKGRDVVVGRKPTETELKLAEALGLKKGGCYKGFPTHGSTLFTSPPEFSTNPQWIPVLIAEAKRRGLTLIDSKYPEEVAKDFLNKLKNF